MKQAPVTKYLDHVEQGALLAELGRVYGGIAVQSEVKDAIGRVVLTLADALAPPITENDPPTCPACGTPISCPCGVGIGP